MDAHTHTHTRASDGNHSDFTWQSPPDELAPISKEQVILKEVQTPCWCSLNSSFDSHNIYKTRSASDASRSLLGGRRKLPGYIPEDTEQPTGPGSVLFDEVLLILLSLCIQGCVEACLWCVVCEQWDQTVICYFIVLVLFCSTLDLKDKPHAALAWIQRMVERWRRVL